MSETDRPRRGESILGPLRAHRPVLLPLGLALLVTYAYFVDRPAWNQNSRLALTRALVETRSTIIDPYHVTTGDKSFRAGHFYCDKAPGVSLLSAVPYAVLYGIRRATGGEQPDVRVLPLAQRDVEAEVAPKPEARQPGDKLVYNFAHRLALYLCGLFAIAVPTVLGIAAVWRLALHLGADVRRATFVALAAGLATPIFPYATALYGHAPCGAALTIAVALVVVAPPRAPRSVAWWTGACLGLAVIVEYPAAAVAMGVVGLAAWRHGGRFALHVVAGGAPWALLLAAYHTAAFGHPLATGYDFVWLPRFAEGMKVRYGIGAPDPVALHALTFGAYRGLVYLSPVLILAGWGVLARLVRPGPQGRTPWIAIAAITTFYLLLNAGYYMWDGGAAYGPRHVVPMLGLLALGLVPAARVVPVAFAVLAAVSAFQMLAGAVAGPEAAQFGNAVWEYAWPRLRSTDAGPPTDLGRLVGLPAGVSLLPLAAVWLWAWPRREGPTSASEPESESESESRATRSDR